METPSSTGSVYLFQTLVVQGSKCPRAFRTGTLITLGKIQCTKYFRVAACVAFTPQPSE